MFPKARLFNSGHLALMVVLILTMLGTKPAKSVLADTLTVTNTNDSGAGSLRQAIANAVDGDTITFAPSLAGQTITLASSLPIIDKVLTVDAGEQSIIIDGAGDYRIFQVISTGNLTINHLTIQNGNHSEPCFENITLACGGGIYNDGSLTVRNSIFSGNSSQNGGAIFIRSGITDISNSTFLGNSATNVGGAVLNWIGTLNVSNSTFHGNSANYGGAIYNDVSVLKMTNSTLSGNSATHGGGLYNAGNVDLLNNILANSTLGEDCYSEDGAGKVLTNVNNIIENNAASPNSCGIPALTSDPKLGPLASNGGLTPTTALLSGSPAINAGDDASCPALDQRGVKRPQGSGCDIGAYESPTVTPFRSGGAQDGWVLETSELSNQGGAINAGASTFNLGDTANRRQYRTILHFNTSSLPDDAVITRVALKIRKHSLTGTNPFTTHLKIAVDIRRGAFSNSGALQATDFQMPAGKQAVGLIANNPQAGGWYLSTLKAVAYPFVNRTGITQFRLCFQLDDDNDAVADFLGFYSGNAIAANRPVLVIEYYVP